MPRPALDYSLILLAAAPEEGPPLALGSLAALPPGRWEALVVATGQEARLDQLQAAAAQAGGALRVLVLPPCPPGAARNQAVEQSSGEVLFFSQVDCRLPPDLIARLDADLSDPDLAGVGGLCRPDNMDDPWARLLGLELELERGEELPDALCAAYRRREFLPAGGFDPHDQGEGLENYELAYRMTAGGRELALDPELAVRRALPATLGAALAWAYHLGRNRFRNILHRRRLGLGSRLGARHFWQSVLVLSALGFPLAMANQDPGRAFTASAVCLLLLYPLNRSFLKKLSQREPDLMNRALLWCLLRPFAWTLGLLKASLDRVSGQGEN